MRPALKAAQLFLAGVPTELGGGGASFRELALILAALARGCGSTALAFAMHTHPVMLDVWRWRNDGAPVEPLLRRIAAEELVLVSSGGSDWLDGAGRAERVEGGYRVTGVKRFASGSPSGDVLMTSAVYDDPADGPTVLHFGVPLKAPGVSLVDNWRALGMRGTGSGDVSIDGFFLPEAAVGMRRPKGRWHRLFHIISLVAFPLIYAVYVSLAEVAHEPALERATPRRGSAHRASRGRDGDGAVGGAARPRGDAAPGRYGRSRPAEHEPAARREVARHAGGAGGRRACADPRGRGRVPARLRARAHLSRHPGHALSPADARAAAAPGRPPGAGARHRRLSVLSRRRTDTRGPAPPRARRG
jgi:alkylation response protein AidB-like acyl-CoA dehydrogenase